MHKNDEVSDLEGVRVLLKGSETVMADSNGRSIRASDKGPET